MPLTSNIRFLHNVVNGSNVDIYIRKNKIINNLSYGELTSYIEVESGYSEIIVKTGEQTIITKKITLNCNSKYTAIIGGSLSDTTSLKIFMYDDKNGCAKEGESYLRFMHNVYGAPGVDVYINNGGLITKIFTNITYGNESVYEKIKLGPFPNMISYTREIEIFVTGTDTKVAGPIPIYIVSGGMYTLIAIGNVQENVIGAKFSHDNGDRCNYSCETLEKDLNVQEYMGKWYLIASIPQFYDKGCERQTAEYTLLSDSIKVYNKCFDKDRNLLRTITGKAVPESPCQPAALIVSFPDQPFNPIAANYLIHKTNYIDYAIVGSPTRESFYILSRKSKMTSEKYNKFLRYAKKLGYNSELITPTYHAIIPDHTL